MDADVYYQRTADVLTAFTAQFCRRHARKSIYAGASDVDFLPGKEDIRYARDKKIFQWGVRNVNIRVLKWGSFSRSLAIMKPRTGNTHVNKMVQRIQKS